MDRICSDRMFVFVAIMASDLIESFLRLNFVVKELQDIAFKILPTLKLPPQNCPKLITMIADWVRDDRLQGCRNFARQLIGMYLLMHCVPFSATSASMLTKY